MPYNRLTLFRLFALLSLLLAMTVTHSAELLIDRCESECEQKCDESCENCGDCVDCQRTMPMLVDDVRGGSNVCNINTWLSSLAAENVNDLFCGNIEHPPQLAQSLFCAGSFRPFHSKT